MSNYYLINTGFFNVSSNKCFGDIVTDHEVIQLSTTHNVNFGIRNGSFVTGYVNEDEIKNKNNDFEFIISGMVLNYLFKCLLNKLNMKTLYNLFISLRIFTVYYLRLNMAS